MKKIERTYLNLVLVVSALTALYLVSQGWKNHLLLEKVNVYDTHILTDSQVKELADVREGSPLYQLSLLKISERLEKNPFVKEAVVVRALPYDLAITIHERNPIALVATANSMLSVDDRGIVLPVPLERKNDLPVITNVEAQLQVGDTVKGNLTQAVKFISDANDFGASLSASIAEVRLIGDNLVAYATSSSLPIIIGKGDFERKLLYLHEFLTKVAETGNSEYSYVDLRYNGQIVLGDADAGVSASGFRSPSSGISPDGVSEKVN
ncbi:MAG: FtsQ-type POTRA domain-containing protein [Bacteroidetes bacterium]|nr:FtsQ-type POTRA domain-containing protein [Bacteroidota bacterium]